MKNPDEEIIILNENDFMAKPGDISIFRGIGSLTDYVEAEDVRDKRYYAITGEAKNVILTEKDGMVIVEVGSYSQENQIILKKWLRDICNKSMRQGSDDTNGPENILLREVCKMLDQLDRD